MLPVFTNLFAAAANCTKGGFFGLIPWWQYLPSSDFGGSSGCDIVNFEPLTGQGIPLILLAVVDDLLRIAGIIAVIYVLYGAVLYMTTQGNADQASKALSTIINALIGLGISIFAIVIVSFIGNSLGG